MDVLIAASKRVVSSGSCHKCGASFKRKSRTNGKVLPVACNICDICETRYHMSDCGGYYAKAGILDDVVKCPMCSKICVCNDGMIPCHVSKVRKARRELSAQGIKRTQKKVEIEIDDETEEDLNICKRVRNDPNLELERDLAQWNATITKLKTALKEQSEKLRVGNEKLASMKLLRLRISRT